MGPTSTSDSILLSEAEKGPLVIGETQRLTIVAVISAAIS